MISLVFLYKKEYLLWPSNYVKNEVLTPMLFIVAELVDEFKKDYEVINVDGARVVFDGGWGLVRTSNTQPVLVLRFEADNEERLEEIRSIFMQKIEKKISQ